MAMTKEQLAVIRERCEKAIEDPWVPKKFGSSGVSIYKGPVKVKGCGMNHGGEICEMDDPDCSNFKASQLKNTATFIAHARQDVPALLNEVERLQSDLEIMNRMIDSYQQEIIPGFRERAEKAEQRLKGLEKVHKS